MSNQAQQIMNAAVAGVVCLSLFFFLYEGLNCEEILISFGEKKRKSKNKEEDVRRPTCYHRLVIGCHSGLGSYEGLDIGNGKTLITNKCGVRKEDIKVESTMPSESDLQAILSGTDSHMFLVFVGHCDQDGNLALKNRDDGTKQGPVAPHTFLSGLMGCQGTLTLRLYTCHSHKWDSAIREFRTGEGRDHSLHLTIDLTVCTQSARDEANDKAFNYQMKDYHTKAVGQKSKGVFGKGHEDLHNDIQDGV